MDTDELVKRIMHNFIAYFVPDAECLYLHDSMNGVLSSDTDKLKVLGFDMSQERKMPDVILYSADKDWLYLVESIASGGTIDEARFEELSILTKRVEKVKVFVTAFPNS